ncbi:MAG: V-type ATP synthase subunit E family protein [Candidatus Micrarchaeia archaeon]|jgi:vacuolar-type H+-ATPase subunit E/Vma4
MGFEELTSELHKGADAEGKKIIHAAEKNAAKIAEDAKGKAEETLRAAKKEATEFARQEAAERITSAKLAAKKMVDEAREEAVEASISQAWHKFRSDSMKKSSYPELLNALVKEGMAELGVSQATLYVRDDDRQYLQGYQFKALPQEYSGGVIVESQGGRVRVNRTLEEIFAQKKPALRKDIYDRLF